MGRDAYDKMEIDAELLLLVRTVGDTSNIYGPYEQFKKEVEEVEEMEQAGLVKILEKNEEIVDRRRYVHCIRFRKLQ